MVEHVQLLFDETALDPAYPIAQLSLAAIAERLVGSPEVEGNMHMYPPPKPLHHYIEEHVAKTPDAIALSFKDQHLSYSDLNRRANQVAHYLISLGAQASDRVIVFVEPSLDILICLLGVLKAGSIYVPLDPSYPTERLSVIIDEIRPCVVLTQAALKSKLPSHSAPVVCVDRDNVKLQEFAAHDPAVKLLLGQTAFIVYTSGTTGKPKGVMLSHANLVHYVLVAQAHYGFDRFDVMPAMARYTFSITMFELMTPLVSGGRLVILERNHVLDFKRLVATLQQVTIVHASPSLLRKLVSYIDDERIDPVVFRGLKHVSSGGDMVSADLMESLKRIFETAEIFVIYGCSEVSCMGCTYQVPRNKVVTRSSVGVPFKNVLVRVLDAQQNLVPIGVEGEIFIGGAGVGSGYLDREDLTREKFISIEGERYYRTGDIGRIDISGNLEILGRSDFQIKLRGIRIELGEIESTLRRVRGVKDCVVVGQELKAGEKTLVAYLTLDGNKAPEIREIRTFLQEKLPDYMVPAAFVVLKALPVNINLKVDRKALPMPTVGDMASGRAFVAPRNQAELQLARIWESILNISPIGIQDNFFEIGGDSLLAVDLMIEIEKKLNITLPLSTLLTESTIERLAQQLDRRTQTRPCIVPLREGGAGCPIFFIHDGEGETLLYRKLAHHLSSEHPVYGVQPLSRDKYPMLHSRLSDVVDFYTEQICKVQPEGTYLLGGLCIGGFIAFEIARALQAKGQSVGMVALIDVAHVKLVPGGIVSKRWNRFSNAIDQSRQLGLRQHVIHVLRTVSKKAYGVIAYAVRYRIQKTWANTQMRLFRYCLDKGLLLPPFLQNISVNTVLRFAEKEYVIPEQYKGEVILLRATQKDPSFDGTLIDGTLIDDTPYVDIFNDPNLGWENRATEGFKAHDIPGGHSSMLQEPNVQVLAAKIQSYVDVVFNKSQHSGAKSDRETNIEGVMRALVANNSN